MAVRRCLVAILALVGLVAGTLDASGPAAGRQPVAGRQAGPAGDGRQAAPQRPSFGSSTVLVPVVIRVIDNKTGKPVTDLQQEDFTVLQDGLPQPIRHFERHTYSADAAPAPGARPLIRVRTPQAERLREALDAAGIAARVAAPDRLEVPDAPSERIGLLAAERSIPIFEIVAEAVDLEDVFLQLTGTSDREETR